MKVQYFEDTDTLYIELRADDVAETRDLDDNTVLDLDADGNVCALTFENASAHMDNVPSEAAELASLPAELKERIRAYFEGLFAEAVDDVKAGRVVDGPATMQRLRESLEARGE
jgi:uncharacterized protein YuzE